MNPRSLLHISVFVIGCAQSGLSQNWAQVQKIISDDRGPGAGFGASVAMDGERLVVGAWLDSVGPIGDVGAAYVFILNDGAWSLEQKLISNDGAQGDFFGSSVAISGDRIVVSAPGQDLDASGEDSLSAAGAVYIFHSVDGLWVLEQKIVADDQDAHEGLGAAVDLHGDRLIIGAPHDDEDVPGGGGPNLDLAGSAHFFHLGDSGWVFQQKVVASEREAFDWFGYSVAIHGDLAVVGSPYEDENAQDTYYMEDAGSIYIFTWADSIWSLDQKVVADDRESGDYFGLCLALEPDRILVGAPANQTDTSGMNYFFNAGAVHEISPMVSGWYNQQKIVASDRGTNDQFGSSIDLNGDRMVVGAPEDAQDVIGNDPLYDAGSAYLFNRQDLLWQEVQKVVAPDRAVGDKFGMAVALSGPYAVIGARLEDEDEQGLNTMEDAGSAYVLFDSTTVGTGPALSGSQAYFSIFPNPMGNGIPTINMAGVEGGDRRLDVEVHDALGRRVWSHHLTAAPCDGRIPLEIRPDLAAGTYSILLKVDGSIRLQRLVKQ